MVWISEIRQVAVNNIDDNGVPAKVCSLNPLNVQPSRKSFFENREFRTFQEFAIPASGSIAIRAFTPINVIIFHLGISVDSSSLRMSLYAGGSASGPWTAMPIFPKNGMTEQPSVATQVTLDYDGTHTGGTLVDLMRISSSGSANKGVSVGVQDNDERGMGPGTYYFRLQNLENVVCNCVFHSFWEERP